MIPNAKKNLHACQYHFEKILKSNHFEELEINFGAFVTFARTVTSILQKEFSENKEFQKWYGDRDNPINGTKRFEMKNDPLCKFFYDLRSKILKEGITHLKCSTKISNLDTNKDMIDRPANSVLEITSKGMYYKINLNTAKEDRLPAKTKGIVSTNIWIEGAPNEHLGKKLERNDLITISRIYYKYLESMVEERTGIINKKQ